MIWHQLDSGFQPSERDLQHVQHHASTLTLQPFSVGWFQNMLGHRYDMMGLSIYISDFRLADELPLNAYDFCISASQISFRLTSATHCALYGL